MTLLHWILYTLLTWQKRISVERNVEIIWLWQLVSNILLAIWDRSTSDSCHYKSLSPNTLSLATTEIFMMPTFDWQVMWTYEQYTFILKIRDIIPHSHSLECKIVKCLQEIMFQTVLCRLIAWLTNIEPLLINGEEKLENMEKIKWWPHCCKMLYFNNIC